MGITVSRTSLPYLVVMMSIFVALAFGVVVAIAPAGSRALPVAVGLLAAGNAVRVWVRYRLDGRLMGWMLGSMLVIMGLGALALRALVAM
jgi:hypothetical protein